MRLYEKYRPRHLADLLGQETIAARVAKIIERGALGGNAFLISGPSGAGKTSLAWIMARHMADEQNIVEADAIDCTPSRIGEVEDTWRYAGMGEQRGRVWIFNEVHTMSAAAVGKWLTVMERMPDTACVIFTTTADGLESFGDARRDAKPFLSRCMPLALAQRGLAEKFAQRAMEIAQAEGLDGKPFPRYLKLVQERANNMRAVLQFIESGGMMD